MGPDASLPHAPERFIRPKIDVTKPTAPEEGCILTLPDLVEFNSVYNPYHLFCVQYSHNISLPPTALSHGDLYDAVLRFSSWLISHRLAQRPEVVNGNVVKARPVGMLMSSDVMWFIAFVSLVRLGVPVRRISVVPTNAAEHDVRRYCACLLGYRLKPSYIWFARLMHRPSSFPPSSMRSWRTQRYTSHRLRQKGSACLGTRCHVTKMFSTQGANLISMVFHLRLRMSITVIEMLLFYIRLVPLVGSLSEAFNIC